MTDGQGVFDGMTGMSDSAANGTDAGGTGMSEDFAPARRRVSVPVRVGQVTVGGGAVLTRCVIGDGAAVQSGEHLVDVRRAA